MQDQELKKSNGITPVGQASFKRCSCREQKNVVEYVLSIVFSP